MQKPSTTTFLWLAPFITFILSFVGLHFFIQTPSFKTPSLIGLTITESAQLLGQYQVSIQVVQHKIDADLPDGTVIKQHPTPGQRVKAHQTVYCTVSQRPPLMTAPAYVGMQRADVEAEAATCKIPVVFHELESSLPTNTVFAQIPRSGQPLDNRKLVCYVSAAKDKQLIFPDITDRTVKEVQEFFAHANHTVAVFHTWPQEEDHTCDDCIVTDQRPLAGSFIEPNKPLSIQINARSKTDLFMH